MKLKNILIAVWALAASVALTACGGAKGEPAQRKPRLPLLTSAPLGKSAGTESAGVLAG